MRESGLQGVVFFVGFIMLAVLLLMKPGYLANPGFLGTIVVAQIVIASVCRYKQSFFMVLMAAFFWAGMELPLNEAWLEGRWVVLAVGSFAGLAIYMRDRSSHKFSIIHLLALFCVLSAIVSASVSAYPQEALLKSFSLFLLFLYCTTGARLVSGTLEQNKLFGRLLVIAEVAVYVTAIAYFGLRESIFGNPNSLGAVMGVIVIPILMWGYLAEDSRIRRRRLGFELCLAVALLMSSFSRAGIAAALISCFLLCLTARRYKLIVAGVATLITISVLVVMLVPPPIQEETSQSKSVASLFLYKGKREEGILGSRRGPWDATLAVIKQHPWFGSGFGTSMSDLNTNYFDLTRARFVDSRMVREHGNSYLAVMEWSGLLGVCPFYLLILASAWQARRVLAGIWRTGNIYSPAVPAAAVVAAGLIGATFEDWLFAVGYHVSVFFWAMAFIMPDLTPPMVEVHSAEDTPAIEECQFVMSAAG